MNGDKQISGVKAVLLMLAVGLPYFFSNFHRYALSIIGPVIAADYGLTNAQLGLLGSVFFYTYAIMQIPCGILADKISPKKLLVLSCILSAVSSIYFSIGSSFTSLILARMLTGFATALVYVPAMSIIRNQFGDAVFGSMVGIMIALGKAGHVCSAAPLKLLNDWIGWKLTFIVIGGISIAIAVMAAFIINEARSSSSVALTPEQIESKKAIKAADTKAILSAGSIALMAWWFIQGGTRLSFQSLWATKFFTEGLGVDATQSSFYLTMMSIGCIFGPIYIGRVSDRVGCMKTLLVTTVAFLAGWVCFAMMKPGVSSYAVALVGLLLGASGAGLFTVGFATIKTFVSKESNGIATGINNFFAFTGSAVFTQFAGNILLLSDGDATAQYSLLLKVFALLTVIVLVLVYITNRSRIKEADVENQNLQTV